MYKISVFKLSAHRSSR